MSKRLVYLISFVLVAGLAGNVMADDLYPPDWAGAEGSSLAIWEFLVDPSGLGYIEADVYEGDTNPHFDPGSIVYDMAPEGVLACLGGAEGGVGYEFNGDGTITIVDELWGRLNNWPEDADRHKKVRFQITYDPASGRPMGESETADGGDSMWIPDMMSTIIADEEGFFCFEFEYEDRNPAAESFVFIDTPGLIINELIIDTICYEGDNPPAGPGRGGADLDEDPENRSTVGIDRTDPLSWVLPDSNDVDNGTVTCDVWFAIDDDYPEAGLYAGDPNFTNYAAQIVGDPTPEEVELVAIPDLPLLKSHTYYWRIDTYDDSTSEPQPVIGRVFTFNTNNQTPSVDIVGDDIVAWLTEGSVIVPLTGVITDVDGPDDLSVVWDVIDEPNSVDYPAIILPAIDEEVITVTATLVGTYELVLTAFDGVDTGEDTVTITVYIDSCEAAKGEGAEVLQSDFNEDCVTDFADFAEFADEWLENIAL